MGEGREIDPLAQYRVTGAADLTPVPPLPAAAIQVPAPASALILARKQLDEDTTKTWLLVALCALLGFMFSAQLIFQVAMMALGAGDPFSASSSIGLAIGVPLAVFAGFAISLVLPALVVIGANRAYRRQYDWITAEMVHGDLALMLVDESYGRMIQEWREGKYYAKFNSEVHLGNTFALRMVHFGSYAMQYFRMSQGQREFTVTPATPLNCWMDGLLLWCIGGLAWLTVIIPLRIVYTYPKNIAARRAALDYLAGKWDHTLEDKYSRRSVAAPAPNWG